jgi:hypothetical protein
MLRAAAAQLLAAGLAEVALVHLDQRVRHLDLRPPHVAADPRVGRPRGRVVQRLVDRERQPLAEDRPDQAVVEAQVLDPADLQVLREFIGVHLQARDRLLGPRPIRRLPDHPHLDPPVIRDPRRLPRRAHEHVIRVGLRPVARRVDVRLLLRHLVHPLDLRRVHREPVVHPQRAKHVDLLPLRLAVRRRRPSRNGSGSPVLLLSPPSSPPVGASPLLSPLLPGSPVEASLVESSPPVDDVVGASPSSPHAVTQIEINRVETRGRSKSMGAEASSIAADRRCHATPTKITSTPVIPARAVNPHGPVPGLSQLSSRRDSAITASSATASTKRGSSRAGTRSTENSLPNRRNL